MLCRNGIERIEGVAGVNIFGETEREMSITITPEALARYGMTVSEVLRRLRAANASITGGDVEEGKRRYVVRTEGDLNTTQLVEEVVPAQRRRGRQSRRRPGRRARYCAGLHRLQGSRRKAADAQRARARLQYHPRTGRQRHQDHGRGPRSGERNWPKDRSRGRASTSNRSTTRPTTSTLLSTWCRPTSFTVACWRSPF